MSATRFLTARPLDVGGGMSLAEDMLKVVVVMVVMLMMIDDVLE
jgi:hypothetical protein